MIYSVSKERNAFIKSSGSASFHWTTDLPGKSSASFMAHGHDTDRFPARVRETMVGLNPYRLQTCFCLIFIMAIYVNYCHMSTTFFKLKTNAKPTENI